jgi:hypothetical protein
MNKRNATSRMHALTLQVWRFVRDAGTSVGLAELHKRFDVGHQDYKATSKRLCNLVTGGYLKSEGTSQAKTLRYRVTEFAPVGQSVVPNSPALAATAAPKAAVLDDDRADTYRRPPGVKGVPPGVPNSVFALGALASGQAGEQANPLPQHKLPPARNGTPAALPPALLAPAQPCFALRSTGELVIQYPGPQAAPIELPPDVTRALFRFLDLLGGTSLNRLAAQVQP